MADSPAESLGTHRRTFAPTIEKVIFIYATLLGLFHVYVLAFIPLDPYIFRSIHVAAVAAIVFLRFPIRRGAKKFGVIDTALIAMGVAVCVYLFVEFPDILFRRVLPSETDMVIGTFILIVSLEAGRRTAGWALPILGLVMIGYALISELPGMLAHPPFSYTRVAGYLLSTEGVFGLPIAIGSTFVALYIFFGAMVDVSGAGDYLIKLAVGLTGWGRGGPAKVALVASSLFGMVSGASSANVVTTGTFTIPMMKRIGYRPTFAAAVESVASTGGIIVPPIMGAGAFIMSEIVGIPYGTIAAAAIVPAILYYFSLYWMVDLEAIRLGLRGLPRSELPAMRPLLGQMYFLLPIIFLIYALVIERLSVIRSAFWAIGVLFVCAAIRPETRMGFQKIAKALAMGAERLVAIMPACAVAGIIVGMLNMTGLGLKIGGLLIDLAGGHLFSTLILTMVLSIFLGMGLPSVPAYIVAATVAAPALIQLGVPELIAHFFVFYFAALSAITPPVAIAAYAAASLADAPPHRTGYLAVKLGVVAFLVPYFFVYGPALLGQGSPLEVIFVTATAALGVFALCIAVSGISFQGPIHLAERLLLTAGAMALINQGPWTDLAGILIISPIILFRSIKWGTKAVPPSHV